MKAVVLAAGLGLRTGSLSKKLPKPLLPVAGKPMISYTLDFLASQGITEFIIVVQRHYISLFQSIIGFDSYKEWPVSYVCVMDITPDGTSGTAASLLAAERKISERFLVSMADGFFVSPDKLRFDRVSGKGSTVYTRLVDNPSSFGVVTRMAGGRVKITERPIRPSSKEVLVGIYIFEPEVFKLCRQVKPSIRGELELTDVLKFYAQSNALFVKRLSTGTTWVDMGTPDGVAAAELVISMMLAAGKQSP